MHLGAKLKGNDGFLLCIIPDDNLEQRPRSMTITRLRWFQVDSLTDLVLWKLRLFPSAHEGDVVGPAQHFSSSNPGVEVCVATQDQLMVVRKKISDYIFPVPSDAALARTSRDLELAWLRVENCNDRSLCSHNLVCCGYIQHTWSSYRRSRYQGQLKSSSCLDWKLPTTRQDRQSRQLLVAYSWHYGDLSRVRFKADPHLGTYVSGLQKHSVKWKVLIQIVTTNINTYK